MALVEGSRTAKRISALQRTELFGSLSHDVVAKIAQFAVARHLGRGQILFSENDEALGLFVVSNGELRSVRQNLEGREQVLSTEYPGAVLAAVPVFSEGKYYSTMIADTESEVLCIQKQYVHRLCREYPELLWNVARVLAHKVRHCAELIESLALRNVEQRLALHLLAIAGERGVPVGNGCVVELTLTRAEVASRIGSTREVVSRTLTHLQQVKLIQMEGRRLVTVPDMRALRALAGLVEPSQPNRVPSEISSDLS